MLRTAAAAGLVVTFCVGPASPAMAVEIEPVFAVAFENDYYQCGGGPVVQNVANELASRDGLFAPRLEPCVFADYLATGQSPGILDGISLSFDLTPAGGAGAIHAAWLRLYVRRGGYPDPAWHAIKLYPGGMNPSDEDCDQSSCWQPEDEFPDEPAWEGWVERAVPLEWLSGQGCDITVRVWNGSVDAALLVVQLRPTLPTTSITTAIGFEDDYEGCGPSPVRQDALAEIATHDGVFAPRRESCVFVDYFATGASQGYLDALSISFDLSGYGPAGSIAGLALRMYLRRGAYANPRAWHAARLYPGLFNQTDEDCDNQATCWSPADEFPDSEGWEGWVTRAIPLSWVAGTRLDVTLRLWDASVDFVEVLVDSPTESSARSWGALKASYR